MEEKTRADVEQLKENWRRYPIFDIEDTEGFELYRAELLQFRKATEAEWKAKAENKRQHLASLACPLSFNVWVDYGKDDRGHSWQNCKMEQCALWDEDGEVCSLKAISEGIFRLTLTLENRPR